jgi:hypothetical protein
MEVINLNEFKQAIQVLRDTPDILTGLQQIKEITYKYGDNIHMRSLYFSAVEIEIMLRNKVSDARRVYDKARTTGNSN